MRHRVSPGFYKATQMHADGVHKQESPGAGSQNPHLRTMFFRRERRYPDREQISISAFHFSPWRFNQRKHLKRSHELLFLGTLRARGACLSSQGDFKYNMSNVIPQVEQETGFFHGTDILNKQQIVLKGRSTCTTNVQIPNRVRLYFKLLP